MISAYSNFYCTSLRSWRFAAGLTIDTHSTLAHLCCSVDSQGQARLGGLPVRFTLRFLTIAIGWYVSSEKILCIYSATTLAKICELYCLQLWTGPTSPISLIEWLVQRSELQGVENMILNFVVFGNPRVEIRGYFTHLCKGVPKNLGCRIW